MILIKCTSTAPLYVWEAHNRQQSGHHYTAIRIPDGKTRKAALDQTVNPSKRLKWLKRSHGPFEELPHNLVSHFYSLYEAGKTALLTNKSLCQICTGKIYGGSVIARTCTYAALMAPSVKAVSGHRLWTCLTFAHLSTEGKQNENK